MPTPTDLYLSSFADRCRRTLAGLSRELAAALAGGDDYALVRLSYKGELLRQGLRSVTTLTNQLTPDQRLYIVEKLLGLLLPLTGAVSSSGSSTGNGAGLTLALGLLAARTRGQVDTLPLTVSGNIAGAVGAGLPAGAQLVLTRDGREVGRQTPAGLGRFVFTDATPGLHYQVVLTGTVPVLSAQGTRPLVSPVLLGTGVAGLSATLVAQLPVVNAGAGFLNGVLRGTVMGTRNRIELAVPVSVGSVVRFTQPNDNDSDITPGFSSRTLTLNFGADGQDDYVVWENYADFLGAFTFDAHLG